MEVSKRPEGGHSFVGEFTWADFDQACSIFREKGIAVAIRRVVGWRSEEISRTLDSVVHSDGPELKSRTGRYAWWDR